MEVNADESEGRSQMQLFHDQDHLIQAAVQVEKRPASRNFASLKTVPIEVELFFSENSLYELVIVAPPQNVFDLIFHPAFLSKKIG